MERPWIKYYQEGWNERETSMSLYGYLRQVATTHPRRKAIKYYSLSMEYAEVLDKVDFIACKLASLGLVKGDVVGICLPSTPAAIIMIYALNKIGIISFLINDDNTNVRIAERLRSVNAKGVVLLNSRLRRLYEITRRCELSTVIACSLTDYLGPWDRLKVKIATHYEVDNTRLISGIPDSTRVFVWNEYIHKNSPTVDSNEISDQSDSPDDIAMYFQGSASGENTNIAFTNRSISLIISKIRKAYRFDDSDFLHRVLSVVDISYCLGFVYTHLTLCSGYEAILLPRYSDKVFYKSVVNDEPTVVVAYPICYDELRDYINAPTRLIHHNLSYINLLISCGSSFTSTDLIRVNEMFAKAKCLARINETYGLAECLSVCTYNPEGKTKPNSVGIPIPGNNMKIVIPKSSRELSHNEEGEICVNSEFMLQECPGTDDKMDQITRKHPDGRLWLHTGDIGHMDEDGYFYFHYSLKRCVNVGGVFVSLMNVEKVISSVYGVEDVCVVNFTEADGEDRLIAIVVPIEKYLFDNSKLTELRNAVIRECELILTEAEIPQRIEYKVYLPKNSIGETDCDAVVKELLDAQIKTL